MKYRQDCQFSVSPLSHEPQCPPDGSTQVGTRNSLHSLAGGPNPPRLAPGLSVPRLGDPVGPIGVVLKKAMSWAVAGLVEAKELRYRVSLWGVRG